MITIDVVISSGSTVVASIPLDWGITISAFFGFTSFIVGLLVLSYRYGVKVGQALGYDKGSKDGQTQGFLEGKKDFKNSTKVYDLVSCPHNPLKHIHLNGISIIKKNDGTLIDVECPYLNKDKTCQNTNQTCVKL